MTFKLDFDFDFDKSNTSLYKKVKQRLTPKYQHVLNLNSDFFFKYKSWMLLNVILYCMCYSVRSIMSLKRQSPTWFFATFFKTVFGLLRLFPSANIIILYTSYIYRSSLFYSHICHATTLSNNC